MNKILDPIEASKLVKNQPVGTFLVFGDGENDSIMIKRGKVWVYYRVQYEIDGPEYGNDNVAHWLTGGRYLWSLS